MLAQNLTTAYRGGKLQKLLKLRSVCDWVSCQGPISDVTKFWVVFVAQEYNFQTVGNLKITVSYAKQRYRRQNKLKLKDTGMTKDVEEWI